MGIKVAGWQENLVENLKMKGIAAVLEAVDAALLLKFEVSGQLVLNLIALEHPLPLQESFDLRSSYHNKGVLLVQLWEDVWLTRPLQVLSRITSILGMNRTVHGRKTKIITVSQPQADEFFERYHLQASASARYKYALVLEDEMVAMASFSGKRKMTRREEQGYTSVEMIRFATKDGITVQGGLSKLIGHIVKTINPSDVMTYTDMDWSQGKGYLKLGFELADTLAPAEIWLNKGNLIRYFPHRLPEELKAAFSSLSPSETAAYLLSMNYIRIYNTGNLKHILQIL